jgi:cytochrome c peroxidase
MRNKIIFSLPFLIGLLFFTVAFVDDNPYFSISKKDVVLIIPKGFPKPLYKFSGNKITPERFVLGRSLFYDPILSKDSSISCASCHQRFAAFAHIDHPLSHGINGLIGKRNVPALQNLIWKDAFMWDGGVNNLEVQPLNPLTNPVEMNESLSNILFKLQRNKKYVSLFKNAWKDTLINSERLLKSLAQFTGLMVSADSRYDRYMNGRDTLSKAELNGLKLFRTSCARCHKEPLFTDNSYRRNGLKIDCSLMDSGRATLSGLKEDYMKFKVPSLRNVEMTYPYMHDGRLRNLQQVLDHYTKSFSEDEADPELKGGVKLTGEEKQNIIAFLKTLTDKTFLYDRRFADPAMN